MLVRQNREFDEAEAVEELHGIHLQRVQNAARLEGISFEEAKQKRKGFRYLY